MRTTLEPEDLDLIAQKVADILEPYLCPKKEPENSIFSVEELATYLRVSPKWVYDHKHELPCFKLGGRLCFRKRDIDREIDKLFLNEQTKRNPQKDRKRLDKPCLPLV